MLYMAIVLYAPCLTLNAGMVTVYELIIVFQNLILYTIGAERLALYIEYKILSALFKLCLFQSLRIYATIVTFRHNRNTIVESFRYCR